MKRVSLFLLILTSGLAANPLELLNQQNDRGFWFEQNLFLKIPDHWVMLLRTEQRWGADCRILWFHSYIGSISYDLSKLYAKHPIFTHFLIGPGYYGSFHLERIEAEKIDHRWVYLNRPFIETDIRMSLADWTIANRLRAEYLLAHGREPASLIRDRVTIFTPWKWTPLNINPYVQDEFFFREEEGFHQNRLRVGLDVDLYKDSLDGLLYWQWRTVKGETRWIDTYAIGLSLIFSF